VDRGSAGVDDVGRRQDLVTSWRESSPTGHLFLDPYPPPAAAVVTFYALDAAAEPRIRSLLHEFGETLPSGIGFSLLT
jgi:hypothetical protein